MGAFDNYDDCEKFSENFNQGDTFRVQKLEVGPTLNTEFGEGRTFIVTVDNKRYMGFGAGIVAQAERQEQGDFPANVTLSTKDIGGGRSPMKVLIPASDVPATATTPPSDDIPF